MPKEPAGSAPKEAVSYARTRRLFLRALSAVYGIAFVSLAAQVRGLVGSRGILPAGDYLASVAGAGPIRFWFFPTLFWLNSSDAALVGACALGAVLAALAFSGTAPRAALAGAWALYLSLVTVGQDFLGFQWDALLLEAGFLALFLAPAGLQPDWRASPSGTPVFLFRWLVFRFMLSSGLVKLLSGDPHWRDLTAMRFHYQTQPLPAPTSWAMHHLPARAHAAEALVMFAIELVLPFFVFGPRRARLAAFAGFAGLQLVIGATGNYGFFNLLTLALCLPLLDDGLLPGADGPARPAPPASAPVKAVAALFLALSAWQTFTFRAFMPLAPWGVLNNYGLFAVMTTERDEIVIEGSDDGSDWKAYELPYKPGDPARRPPFVEPHMPRLDWQLWFAALGDVRASPWFPRLCARLLEGSPPVLALFERNPFPEKPPRYVRARLYRYDFTTPSERRLTGRWWARRELGLYLAPISSAD